MQDKGKTDRGREYGSIPFGTKENKILRRTVFTQRIERILLQLHITQVIIRERIGSLISKIQPHKI